MTAIAGWIGRHRLPTFFGLAFAFSWSSMVPLAFGWMEQIEFQSWGPLAAALIVLGVTEGTAGLQTLGRRLIRWRVGYWWWAVALVVPVALHVLVAVLNERLGGPVVDLARISWGSALAAFAFRLVMPLDGPMGEEPGWRGYAVPELQRRWSPLQSATILGVLAAAWHAPLLFGGSLDFPIELATTFVATFFYVWLFNRTGGSLLIVLVFHAGEGVIQEAAFGAQGADLVRTSWISFAVWTAMALAVVVLDRAAWRRSFGVRAASSATSVGLQKVSA